MIIITGAGRGIGKFLFNRYKTEPETVIGTWRGLVRQNMETLDIASPGSIIEFCSRLELEDETTLINCAGVNYNAKLEKANVCEWAQTVNVNLIGTASLIRYLLPKMIERGHGRIINLSSVVPQMGVPGTTAYAASKAGLWGLTKSLAKEVGKKGITVNNINLGYFDCGMIEEVPKKLLCDIVATIPAGRLGEADEIKATIDYIRKTPYLNGASIDLNGGLF